MKLTKTNLKLYAVTDRAWLDGRTLKSCVAAALAGGATMIQLREKQASFEQFLQLAQKIKPLCQQYQVPLIINDNVAVAKACGADGVHIGQGDQSIAQVKAERPAAQIIGVSVQTVAQARQAEQQGASYLGVGAMFATQTKGDATAVSFTTLKQITTTVNIPVCAIGGIHQGNIKQLYGTGIAGVALVSEIFDQQQIQAHAQILAKLTIPFQ
ncbi:thiamine phosphate synthase [Loigolactobacillus rennini]|uniref:Thiamine-phosphate synthase n=1 Tax=Loigolactobacillus rennini DSM 20253 TaxID=1423796 RepID=A0A0R2D537_9LACO|nr:thiamine phosphate synthase [Loigolactobacillus rennini]KRM99230.1 thiamine-phosphate pyrophosphorylase [Loigolactobacillus rennini DSM 20253]